MKRSWVVIGLVLVAVVAFSTWRWLGPGVQARTRQISREIRLDLKRRDMPDDAPWRDRRTQTLVRAFYADRKMRPAWTDGGGPTGQARDLAEVIGEAAREGLNPEDYSAEALAEHLEENSGFFTTADPRALAEFDLLCTIAAFHYMSDVHDGRISPRSLDAEWVAKRHKGDIDSMLADAVRHGRVKATLLDLPPAHEGYRKLREARARYAEIVEAGGWPAIPPGAPLARGQRGKRVEALRARLIAAGDLPASASTTGTFDASVENAVRRYQTRHGRDADGVVREQERDELNVPAAQRLRQIELNMERWRWAQRSFGARYLMVNIPEYALHVYEGGRSVLDMRVVVGKALTATPVFSDRMTQVVVNPNWNVPESIVTNEFTVAMMEDPGYLAKNRIRIFASDREDAGEVDPGSVNWSDTEEVKRLRFRQDPGDLNALGRIKFLLPNQFDVYLHDTPAGALFSREERSFSHGCVRVERPLDLARYVLRGRPEASPGTIEELIASDETKWLKIPRPLPVHILYFTAFVDERGGVGFREDVYGIDQDQSQELRKRNRAQARSRA
jgi:murein L,D-transpeptidase YcbB/YkuD